ncbi:MAG: hypothetical protein HOP16_21205 [Acidobacteria bacterium]|nr:hypothetical protein [Acidobacteriota bacterium]
MKVSVSGPRRIAYVLAALSFAAHAAYVAPSLEDIDSINFALGLRDFDPAKHQPHPPGSPVYIALGRLLLAGVTAVRPGLEQVTAEALTLGLWSLLAGVVAIVAAAELFTLVAPERRTANLWATALLAASPLFWLSGLRPMSDLPGLAMALVAQVLLLQGRTDRRRFIYGAVVSGLAVGIRVQTAWLTAPLFLLAIVHQRGAGVGWLLTRPIAAVVASGLAWAVPMVLDSGGLSGYLAALGTQAGEDFAWVNMLWLDPTPRRLAFTLYETFALPWGSDALAAVVTIVAAIGSGVALLRDRRAAALLLIAFGPYTAFHLLFQETLTVRYALPTLVPVAWLAAFAIASTGRFANIAGVPLLAAVLFVSIPLGIDYGKQAHPAFRAIDAMAHAQTAKPAGIYSHYSLWRALQARPLPSAVEPRRQYEWLGPATYWKEGGTLPVWFLADPRRSDMALIDPQAMLDVDRYSWAVADRRELGGSRPLGANWYRINPPGWFVGEGWSLTPEAGGLAFATGTGPDSRPIEAWVRRRPGPLHLAVGGRHLGNPGDPDAEFELALDGQIADSWTLTVVQRNFLRFLNLPLGVADGPGAYARLTITSRPRGGDGRRAAVAVRQFDIQPANQFLYAFEEGWHEAEYDAPSGRQWRWSSERSILRVSGAASALRLSMRGESPLRYLDAPPTVRVSVGGHVIGQFQPDADFEWTMTVPAEDLSRADGAIVIETDPVYLPGPAEGTSDERHLGLRLFETRLDQIRVD